MFDQTCFILAVFQPPINLLAHIEMIFNRFFWGENKRHWRSWRNLAYPTLENGLGFRSLFDIVDAFSSKMWWKCQLQDGIWARYIHEVSWAKSFSYRRLQAIDHFM